MRDVTTSLASLLAFPAITLVAQSSRVQDPSPIVSLPLSLLQMRLSHSDPNYSVLIAFRSFTLRPS